MPSPHNVKLDKNWIDVVEESNLDFFLSSFGDIVDRTKGTSSSKDVTNKAVHSVSLPPLRLRTPRGGELEIDSTFQKQLRVAKLCHLLGLPEVLTEWRFPKAQVPSRPDYSRSNMPMFRHTGKPEHREVEPQTSTPSKYHMKNLQDIEELQELRSDNVSSYVAAYLESSPRDPLAAEESSRKASLMLNNKSAPRKVYLPIVNRANVHDKPMQPIDVREPLQAFPHWCFGCRLEHGIHSVDTHRGYDPFRDRPVRVGGGFTYMDRQHPQADYMTPSKREELLDRDGNECNWKDGRLKKPGELPKMYRPGFVPFKPKVQQKKHVQPARLPNISESEDIPADVPDFDARVLLGYTDEQPIADLHHIQVDVQVNNKRREQLPSPDYTFVADNEAADNVSTAQKHLATPTAASAPVISFADSIDPAECKHVLDSQALGAGLHGHLDEKDGVEERNPSTKIEVPTLSVQRDSPDVDLPESVGPNERAESRDELNSSSTSSANEMEEGTTSTKDGSHAIPRPVDLTSSLQQTVLVTSYAQEEMEQVVNLADLAHSVTSSTEPLVGSPEPHFLDFPVSHPHPLVSTESSYRKVARGFRAPYKHIVLNKIPAKPASTLSDNVVYPTTVLTSTELTPADDATSIQALRPVKPSTQTVSVVDEVPSRAASPELLSDPLDRTPSDVIVEPRGVPSTPAPVDSPPRLVSPVVNSPLLGEKPEFRWVVKPLDVLQYESPFVSPDLYVPPPAQRVNSEEYADDNLLAMDTNTVSTTIVTSKEYIPIWTITKEILHDVMDEVLKQIAKKKAPPKKTKKEVVKKPTQKVKPVKQKTPSPPPQPSTPPSPFRQPSTPPVKEPTPPPREPTPPPKAPTPPPKDPTPPPKQPTPPPKREIVLPPLPTLTNFVAPKQTKPVQPKVQPKRFGTSLVSHANSPRDGTPVSALSPSPIARSSPEFEFDIVPRSPSLTSTPDTPDGARFVVRTLDRKIGNEWTFRQRLNVPIIADAPEKQPIVETLPDIVEKPQTPLPQEEPQPEPKPVFQRRIRQLPKTIAKAARTFRRKSGPSVAKKELKSITDPLDYLAKYCLIHPDRLPVYERIFKEVIAKQSPRYQEVYCVLDKSSEDRPLPIHHVDTPPAPHHNLTEQQKHHMRYTASMRDGQDLIAMNAAEYQVSKIAFTMEKLSTKYDEMLDQYDQLEKTKNHRMAMLAKKLYPHIMSPDFALNSKSKKKSGKAKKDKAVEPLDPALVNTESKLTNAAIVQRLTTKEKQQVELDEEVYRQQLKLSRLETKVKSAEERMEELEAERLEMQVWSQELYLQESVQSYHSAEFRRTQSALFNKFNPELDEQMNIEEVEEALRTVNGHLLTEKELQFIYHILKIPGRKVLNFKTFGCIAALSEKVQQLHPVIRKLINKFDFEALDVKMEKCRELYQLLYESNADKPHGTIPIRSLCVELQAGGLTDEHLDFITNKFNSTQKGYVEYMDFLTYVPLFVELHDRICSNPLTTERVS